MSKAAYAAHDLKAGDVVRLTMAKKGQDPKLEESTILKEDYGTRFFNLLNTLPLYEVAEYKISDKVSVEVSVVEITRKPKWYTIILNKLRSFRSRMSSMLQTLKR